MKPKKSIDNPKQERGAGCDKYEMAITDLVRGETMDMSKDELFKHLRECPKCRKDLREWQNIYSAMRTRERFNQPDVKKKMANMIEEVKNKADSFAEAQEKGFINLDADIGIPAGVVYRCLQKCGPQEINELPKVCNLNPGTAREAIGWLGREDKIRKKIENKKVIVSLVESEGKTAPTTRF